MNDLIFLKNYKQTQVHNSGGIFNKNLRPEFRFQCGDCQFKFHLNFHVSFGLENFFTNFTCRAFHYDVVFKTKTNMLCNTLIFVKRNDRRNFEWINSRKIFQYLYYCTFFTRFTMVYCTTVNGVQPEPWSIGKPLLLFCQVKNPSKVAWKNKARSKRLEWSLVYIPVTQAKNPRRLKP